MFFSSEASPKISEPDDGFVRIKTRKSCGVAVRQVRVTSRPAALRMLHNPISCGGHCSAGCLRLKSLRQSWLCRSKPTATGSPSGVAGKHLHCLLGAKVVQRYVTYVRLNDSHDGGARHAGVSVLIVVGVQLNRRAWRRPRLSLNSNHRWV